MKIPIFCNRNKLYRSDCILHLNNHNINFFAQPYDHRVKFFNAILVLKLFLSCLIYHKVYVVVDYWALKPIAFLLTAPYFANKLIIDFYDIFSLRPSHPQLNNSIYEHSIIKNGKNFVARSFELNAYFKKFGIKGKRSIFYPDVKVLSIDSKSANKILANRIVFLGGIGPEDLYKINKINDDIKIQIYLAPEQEIFEAKPNIIINKSIERDNFVPMLNGFSLGISLISENAKVYSISAASKYMVYLESNLIIVTDPRHRISRWYARYFPNSFIFIDDRDLEIINEDFLLKNSLQLSNPEKSKYIGFDQFIRNSKRKIEKMVIFNM